MKDNRTVQFKEWKCSIDIYKYQNNDRMAIELIGYPGTEEEGEPIAYATVNIPEYFLEENEIIIKSYSENEGMLDALEEAGVIKKTGKAVNTGYVFADIAEYIPEKL